MNRFANYLLRFLMAFVCVVSSVNAAPLDGVAAVVNDDVITRSELNNNAAILKKSLAKKKVALPNDAVFQKQVLSKLIAERLQLQKAKQLDIGVSEEKLNASILDIAKRNHLSIRALKKTLKSQGLSWKQYQENIKKEIILSELHQRILGKIEVPKSMVDAYLAQQAKHNKKEYHVLDLLVPLDDTASNQAHKKAYEKANNLKQAFVRTKDTRALINNEKVQVADLGFRALGDLPSIFTKSVSKLKKGQVSNPIKAANGYHLLRLVDIKNDIPEHWITQTNVRHILLKANTPTEAVQAKKRLMAFKKQVENGASFATIAKEYSQDYASSQQGGSIGWVSDGMLVPNFTQAMQQLKPGQMSKPVKTRYGWHLIQVIKRRQVNETPKRMRAVAENQLYQQLVNQKLNAWLAAVKSDGYVKTYL